MTWLVMAGVLRFTNKLGLKLPFVTAYRATGSPSSPNSTCGKPSATTTAAVNASCTIDHDIDVAAANGVTDAADYNVSKCDDMGSECGRTKRAIVPFVRHIFSRPIVRIGHHSTYAHAVVALPIRVATVV